MKCELCNSEMLGKERVGHPATKYECPNGCMAIVECKRGRDQWIAKEYHKKTDADGFYTLYESGARR